MFFSRNREALLLLVGDIVCFGLALSFAIFVRYLGDPPPGIWGTHFPPFSILFLISAGVFFIAGLYEKQTRPLRRKLPLLLFYTQVINALIAIAFFYFIPEFGIEPKTNLFLYLLFSFALVFLWRLGSGKIIRSFKTQPALMVGSGEEMHELYGEMKNNRRYFFNVVGMIDPAELHGSLMEEAIDRVVAKESPEFLIIDGKDGRLSSIHPYLYKLRQQGVRFIDFGYLYEETFDRVLIEALDREWFSELDYSSVHLAYDAFKRLSDVIIASLLGLVSLFVYPVVYVLIKMDDRGPVFFRQERIGQDNKTISILKFRTMEEETKPGTVPNVTTVGRLLRVTRVDELPQLWNVIKRDVALVGPRPEIPHLVAVYEKTIPYYSARHLVKPGLSGWAQIHDYDVPRVHADVEKTKKKLSYDLYYLKYRSFLLDLEIALRTVKTLLSRSGV